MNTANQDVCQECDDGEEREGWPVRAVRYRGVDAFEVEGDDGTWAWTLDELGRIIRWGNVTTGHEPDEWTRKLLEAAHFLWTINGEPDPPWERRIPEAEE